MADIITEVGLVLGMTIATLGTTPITLGLMGAGALVFSLAVGVFKRIKGR